MEIVIGKSPAGSVRGGPDPRVPAPSCAVEKSLESAPSQRKRRRNPWRIKRLQRREIASRAQAGCSAVQIRSICIGRCGSPRVFGDARAAARRALGVLAFLRNPEPGAVQTTRMSKGPSVRRAGSARRPDEAMADGTERRSAPRRSSAGLFDDLCAAARRTRKSTGHFGRRALLRCITIIEGSIDAAVAAGGMALCGRTCVHKTRRSGRAARGVLHAGFRVDRRPLSTSWIAGQSLPEEYLMPELAFDRKSRMACATGQAWERRMIEAETSRTNLAAERPLPGKGGHTRNRVLRGVRATGAAKRYTGSATAS
jgi:hypothetical protein